ncbi:helix-turn-helix domain-containing protein [Corynebacterium sp. UBA2622]|uniref:helix-turn-helix domain-containing protein n=1 Tax=Corynebacterium sp. UBA2622 TaxID=1946393 RepID=UPI0025C1C9E9|nr:helix-turn-helix domain-containing protein [Corynebacterium sp. UBA2622]
MPTKAFAVPAAPTEPYVSLQECADYLGVSAKTVRRFITEKKIPARRVGGERSGAIRLKLSEVDQALIPMGSLTKKG